MPFLQLELIFVKRAFQRCINRQNPLKIVEVGSLFLSNVQLQFPILVPLPTARGEIGAVTKTTFQTVNQIVIK